MESSESFNGNQGAITRPPRRARVGFVKPAIGIGLLAILFYFGQIDLTALATLGKSPSIVLLAFLLVYLTLPLGALRWGILLKTFRITISFKDLFNFVSIAALFNLVLLGTVGGDAVRMLYAWRRVGHGSGRIAISVLADRLFGLFALLFIVVVLTVANWPAIRQVPALAGLGISAVSVFAAGAVGTVVILAAPNLAYRARKRLSRWPALARLAGQIYDIIIMGRRNPVQLSIAFALALILQVCTVTAVVLIAEVLKIGLLAPEHYFFAAPLTLIANALPLTPNGLGVGEVAFEQICRWLEPDRSGAAYSSIFFAFRAVGALVSLSGLISFGIYRRPLRNNIAQ